MSLKGSAVLSIILATMIFCHLSDAMAADPPELLNLRATHISTKKELLTGYLQQLVALEKTLLNNNNTSGASAVRMELRKVSGEIAALPAPQAAAPVVSVPPVKPVITKHVPQTHISEVKGLAGAASFSENNIYTFNLQDIGNKSTLTFWATGRRSPDSYGNVWLITPDGHREKITKWKDRYFEVPATEISGYKKLDPITEDISELVKRPGRYQVEFEWTDGIDPLVIYRVEVTS